MIEEKVSYCGLYCGACPSFHKGTCLGCRSEDKNQSRISKWSCKIRKCCIEVQKIEHCGQCEDFPCKEMNRKLINSHQNDPRFEYRHKIPQNVKALNKLGLREWAQAQAKLWSCLHCGKPIVFYYNKCSACGREKNKNV